MAYLNGYIFCKPFTKPSIGSYQKLINIKLYETLDPHFFVLRIFVLQFSDSPKSPTYVQSLSVIWNIPNCNLDQLLLAILKGYVCKLYALIRAIGINITRGVSNLLKKILLSPVNLNCKLHFCRTQYISRLWGLAHLPNNNRCTPTYQLLSMGGKREITSIFFKWFEGDLLPPSITSIINFEISLINFPFLSFWQIKLTDMNSVID